MKISDVEIKGCIITLGAVVDKETFENILEVLKYIKLTYSDDQEFPEKIIFEKYEMCYYWKYRKIENFCIEKGYFTKESNEFHFTEAFFKLLNLMNDKFIENETRRKSLVMC